MKAGSRRPPSLRKVASRGLALLWFACGLAPLSVLSIGALSLGAFPLRPALASATLSPPCPAAPLAQALRALIKKPPAGDGAPVGAGVPGAPATQSQYLLGADSQRAAETPVVSPPVFETSDVGAQGVESTQRAQDMYGARDGAGRTLPDGTRVYSLPQGQGPRGNGVQGGAPPLFRTSGSVPLESCCNPVSVNERIRQWWKNTLRDDAYHSGDQLHVSVRPQEYGLVLPATIDLKNPLLPKKFEIPAASLQERLAPYVEKAGPLPEVAHLARGATSDVFVIRARVGKLVQRAYEVIKVKSAQIFREVNLERAAAYFRNDLVRYELARELTPGLTFKGERLLEVAKITSTVDEHAAGIVRQEIVHGPDLQEIQRNLDCVLRIRKCSIKDNIAAIGFLKGSGIAGPHANSELQFREIQAKVNAIEHFYRDTHRLVLEYVEQNHLRHYGGHPKGGVKGVDKGAVVNAEAGAGARVGAGAEVEVVTVGFDFNRGQNIRWDGRHKIFKIIDL